MKSRGDRLEHRAVVDERGHQGALLHRPFRPTEVRRFGEGHSDWMPVVDDQNNWKTHEALFITFSRGDIIRHVLFQLTPLGAFIMM